MQVEEKFEKLLNGYFNYYFLRTDDSNPTILQKVHNISETLKEIFNIPNNLNIFWINLQHEDLYNHVFESNFEKIKTLISSPDQVIILWLIGYHMPINYDIINNLNIFSKSINNPVLYCSGSLGSWVNEINQPLEFTISQSLYYEYESYLYWSFKKYCFRSELNSITYSEKRPKKFMFIGTKDYPNRKFLLSNVIKSGQLNQGLVSYKQMVKSDLNPQVYTKEQIDHIILLANSIDHHLPLPEIDNSIEYVEMPVKFFLDTYLNMVTDTYYDTSRGATFISEKVFNAIANQQLFIMMAPPFTLKYLKSKGYQTFSSFIDERYDEIEDPYERILAVNTSFINFINQPIEVIEKIYQRCLPILEHNRRVLFNCNFIEDFNNDIQRAIQEKSQR